MRILPGKEVNDVNERYEEPQVYELGAAVEFFLGDDGSSEDSAKVVACSQCSQIEIVS
jgi:hypothetical protein